VSQLHLVLLAKETPMITIHINEHAERDYWDPKKEEFVTMPYQKSCDLNLEHSLISISKWESKWHVPFITSEKSEEQTLDYIKCMTINQNVPDSAYDYLTAEDIKTISEYINNPMTATTVNNISEKRRSRQIVTSEVIYSWMVGLQIPFELVEPHGFELHQTIQDHHLMLSGDQRKGVAETGVFEISVLDIFLDHHYPPRKYLSLIPVLEFYSCTVTILVRILIQVNQIKEKRY
jgi:hypothetical protein